MTRKRFTGSARRAAVLAAFLFSCPALADHGLFDSDDMLEISLAVDFRDLCRPRDDETCDYRPTVLQFHSDTDGVGELPVDIIVRGGWRAMLSHCSVPPLFIRFDENTTRGTPFSKQKILPLTTHCGQGLSIDRLKRRPRPRQFEQYLLREFLAYRLYNAVSDVSLKVRLLKIRYSDPDKPSRVRNSYAFFTEHFDSLAERTGAEVLERWTFDHEKLDTRSADGLALFQYMIGNSDWSIARQRNILLLEMPDGRQRPVPYDLDMSGLVNAYYAGPPPGLPIDEVTDRYYLGYCHPDVDWTALFQQFTALEPAVFDTIKNTQGLDRGSRRFSKGFLEQFFETLSSEEQRNERLVTHCQPWPPEVDDHMNVKRR